MTLFPAASWTLFLDRDGVINRQLPNDYVKQISEFAFLPGVPDAIRQLGSIFSPLLIVTNQQGIQKGRMTEEQLATVHAYMLAELEREGAHIDHIYHCSDLAGSGSPFRKPAPGMALKAQQDFPGIDFRKSMMVGDSASDMVFGRNLGMITVGISGLEPIANELCDYHFNSLAEFSSWISEHQNSVLL